MIGAAGEGQESFTDLVKEGQGDVEFPDVTETTPALIMYTSGTTGSPKGAVLDHLNLYQQALTLFRVNRIFDESDIALLTAPLFHIAGLGSIAPNFVLGLPTIIYPLGAFNASDLLDVYEKERVTIVFNVPQQWQLICAEVMARTHNHNRIVTRMV